MKRFMFLSIGVLCLAIAALIGFYIGSQQAKAQTPSAEVIGYSTDGAWHYVFLANGDVYTRPCSPTNKTYFGIIPANLMGNYWEGATVTDNATWSGVKEQYKK